MTPESARAPLLAALLAAMALAGCAMSQDAQYRRHHPASAAASTSATMSPGAHHGHMQMMDHHDPKAMCEMHKHMMSGRTPEEQKAMMDERMKSMSPEMMTRYKAMMEQCR